MSPFIEATPSEMRFDCLRLKGILPERITWLFQWTWSNFIMFVSLQNNEVGCILRYTWADMELL